MERREDFEILKSNINGKPLIYLDNAATLQMPAPVMEKIVDVYKTCNGNVGRSIHQPGMRTGEEMEKARETIKNFINATSTKEIIFTSGTTAGVDIISRVFTKQYLHPGDKVLISEMEHHSNMLPWERACKESGAQLEIVPMDEQGDLDIDAFGRMLTGEVKLVAITWVSNVTGTVNPIDMIVKKSHSVGAKVLIDGAQAMIHRRVDVQKTDCDFLVFSGHKMGSLTGTGVLYGKEELLEKFQPVVLGGGMIRQVPWQKSLYVDLPGRLEAGTPNYIGAISLGAAVEYLNRETPEERAAYTDWLVSFSLDVVENAGFTIMGYPRERSGIVSFFSPTINAYDIAKILDMHGIAVRSGTMCAQRAVNHFGVESCVRVSPAFYNTEEEIETFKKALMHT
ncbi:MAG: aminotransferase class V-fold PLP-dependent enzyme, partial [Lachnospiraceae bacterium]